MRKASKVIADLAITLFVTISINNSAIAAGADFLSDAACPDSKYFSTLINKFCWSCTLPFNLMGFSSTPPEGANNDPLCYCKDELGVPEAGYSIGFWSPEKIIEITTTPWCSPTLGGTTLQSDLTSMGTTGSGSSSDQSTMATYHYNYFDNPVFKMLSMFMIPECDKDPGIVDLDMAYMSMIDITWYDDMLAMVFNADAVAFANPIAQAVCMKDCAIIAATSDPADQNWFCAGCDGNMYPFTGHIITDGNPIRNSSLVVTRALASMHRRGLARTTYGEEAMCESVYSPMIPKPMYKISMAWPKAEVDQYLGGSTNAPTLDQNGVQKVDASGNPLTHNISSSCCHPLGDFWMKWGLGRMTPGAGKDNSFVYNIFRYNDCCVRFM